MNRISIILIFLSLVNVADSAIAGPYDKSALNISYLHNTNRDLYHRYWKPAHGTDISFKSNFHFGNLEFGAGYARHEGLESETVEFSSFFIYTGWNYGLPVTDRFSLTGGARVGSFIMRFDDDLTSIEGKTEMELGLEFMIGSEIAISDRIGLNHSFRHRIVYTRNKIELTYLAIGLTYNFDSPAWLKGFLK